MLCWFDVVLEQAKGLEFKPHPHPIFYNFHVFDPYQRKYGHTWVGVLKV